MRYFVGVGLLAIGLALFYAGQAHKKRVLSAFAEITSRGEPRPTPPLNSLATFGEVMKFFILFILCGLALVVTFGYLLFDGGQYLSYFDITGALVAIAGYGFWVSMKTEHRMSDLDWRQPSEAAAPSDEVPPTEAPAMEARAADAPSDSQAAAASSADEGVAEPVAVETSTQESSTQESSTPESSPAGESVAAEAPADAQAPKSASAAVDGAASSATGAAAAESAETAERKTASPSPKKPADRGSRRPRSSPRKPRASRGKRSNRADPTSKG